MDVAIFMILVAISYLLGWHTREIQILYYKLTVKPGPEPKSGVTLGSYASLDSSFGPKKSSVVISPKTPEQLEFEANQRENTLQGSNEGVGNIIERATHR